MRDTVSPGLLLHDVPSSLCICPLNQPLSFTHPFTFSRHGDIEAQGSINAAIHAKIDQIVLAATGMDEAVGPPPRVLDVGSGDGILLEFLEKKWGKDMISTYTGVDLSEAMVMEARRRYPKATFLHQDFLSFHHDQPYDTIIFNEAFHYFPSQVDPLNHAVQLLRPQRGSRIIISHPKGLKSIHRQHEMSPILVPLMAPTVKDLKALIDKEDLPLEVVTDEAVDQSDLYLIVLEWKDQAQ